MERKKFKALSNVCGYLRANPPSASQRGVLILQNVRSDYAEAFSAYLRREQLDAADVEYLQVCEWLQQYDSLSAKKFPWEKSADTVAKAGGKDNEGYRAGYNKNNGYGKSSGGGNGGYAKGSGGGSTQGVGYLGAGSQSNPSTKGKGSAAIRPLAEASNVKVKCDHCKRLGHSKDKCWKLHPEQRPKSKDGDKAVKSFAERGGHLWGLLVTAYKATTRVVQDIYLAPDTGSGETLVPEAIAKSVGTKWTRLKRPRAIQGIGGQVYKLEWQVTLEVSIDFLEGVPTVLLGWKGIEDLEAVVSIPQSAFTSGLLGVTVPLILLTGEADRPAISAMALECRPLDESVIDKRLKTWSFPKVYAKRRKECVPPRARPYPPESREEADVTTWLVDYTLQDGIFEEVYPTKEATFHNVYFNPVFVVPKFKGPRPEGIIKSNVRDFYRLVLDARPSNAATSDFTPGSGW
ncbi:hypothetical protein FOZ62_007460, partial [Perkinsus olseni]